jgi:tRNA nucleotidyltransferase/poly(A) polymerase
MTNIEALVADRLVNNDFECFIVGGAVRDNLLGKQPKDTDFATNATPDQVVALFKDRKVITTGKTFKVVMVDGVEVATYRKDRQNKPFSAKHCKPTYAKTIEEDLSRRDLTINAMTINMRGGALVDIFNGKQDLKEGLIRFVGDPLERIKEDPNRIIRACRFLAKLEGRFEKKSLEVLQNYSHYVKDYIAPERIRIEILKTMELETPSLFFSALHLIGALKYIFPEMDDCFGHQHGKYHLENIGEHLMLAGDIISPRFPLLRLAGFLHDIGKPLAMKIHDGSCIDHDRLSGEMVEKRLSDLKFSKREIDTITQLVYAHMFTCKNLTPKASRKLQKKLADRKINPKDFLRLRLADRLANLGKNPNQFVPIRELIINCGIRKVEEELPFTVKSLALSGGELITIFDLNPSPIVGKLQKHLLNYVIEEGEEYNIKDKLLEESKKFLNISKTISS